VIAQIDQPTSQDAVSAFLTHLEARPYSAATVLAYTVDLSQLSRFLMGSKGAYLWPAITPADLRAFAASLVGRGFAVASVARKVASVSSFFHWLADEHLIPTDPTRTWHPPHVAATTPRLLTRDEVATLVSQPDRWGHPEALRDGAMLRLLAATGPRISEVINLDLTDLDLATDYVRYRGAERERDVPFDVATHDALADYLARGRPHLRVTYRPGRRHVESPSLFVNHRGQRMTRQGFWLNLTAYTKAAGLTGVSPHTFRHSCAVLLLADHVEVADVQSLLGHASIQTTQGYVAMVPRHRVAR